MKNNLPVIIAALVVVVLIVLIFFLSGKRPPLSGSSTPTSPAGPSVVTSSTTSGSVTTTADGLQITDVKVGTGTVAEAGDTVTVNYVGSFPDGQVFDASADHGMGGFSFVLGAGEVIKGWDEGVLGMKVGGERKLVVPPELGYGPSGLGPIPPNATLDFDITLLKVQNP